jgi:hypothetical protein
MVHTEKMSELLLDTAWKSLEFIQARIDRMEDKANNILAFSGILMTIDLALVIESIDSAYISILLFFEIVLLIACVWYGYSTIKLKPQTFLNMVDIIGTIDLTDHVQSGGDLAVTISKRQEDLLNLMQEKSLTLKKSMKWFTLSLGFLLFISFVYLLFALVPLIQSFLLHLCSNP